MRGKVARALRQAAKIATGIYPKSIDETELESLSGNGDKNRIRQPGGVLVLPYPPGTSVFAYKVMKKLHRRGRNG